jgi:hypothetical protein
MRNSFDPFRLLLNRILAPIPNFSGLVQFPEDMAEPFFPSTIHFSIKSVFVEHLLYTDYVTRQKRAFQGLKFIAEVEGWDCES